MPYWRLYVRYIFMGFLPAFLFFFFFFFLHPFNFCWIRCYLVFTEKRERKTQYNRRENTRHFDTYPECFITKFISGIIFDVLIRIIPEFWPILFPFRSTKKIWFRYRYHDRRIFFLSLQEQDCCLWQRLSYRLVYVPMNFYLIKRSTP